MNRSVSFIIAFSMWICFLCGCSILGSIDRADIEYDGKTYTHISPYWEIKDPEKYIRKSVSSKNENLNIRVFGDSEDLIFCEDDSLLYHDSNKALPQNKQSTIECILVEDIDDIAHRRDVFNDVNDFLTVLSSKSYKDIKADNIATVTIYYKDFSACYFYGNLAKDQDNNYWLYSNDCDNYKKINN